MIHGLKPSKSRIKGFKFEITKVPAIHLLDSQRTIMTIAPHHITVLEGEPCSESYSSGMYVSLSSSLCRKLFVY